MQCIYKITNKSVNKIYVGSAVNFNSRKSTHISRLKSKTHHSPKLQNAWNKYGEDEFVFEIVEEVKDKIQLVEREQYWIDLLKPFYNCSPTAGSCLGKKASSKAKKNMSDAQKGKKLTKEQIERRTITRRKNGWNKKPRTEEMCRKISEIRKQKASEEGYIHPLTGTFLSEERKRFMKEINEIPILQYDLEGNFIKEYTSSKQAHLETGMSNTSIIRILKGRVKKPTKFIFKYKNQ